MQCSIEVNARARDVMTAARSWGNVSRARVYKIVDIWEPRVCDVIVRNGSESCNRVMLNFKNVEVAWMECRRFSG